MRSVPGLVCGVLFIARVSALYAADEFSPPPKAERDAVAALAKSESRATIDAEYRVISVTLSALATSDDLKHLAACERLEFLVIYSRNITDANLEPLKALRNLSSLTITNSGISAEGAAALRAALPKCNVLGAGRAPESRDRPLGPGDRGPPGRNLRGPTNALGPVPGPSPARVGLDLLRTASIQNELKITDEQRKAFSNEKLAAALAAVQKTHEAEALAALTPEQQTRFKQLELQSLGPQAFLREDLAKQLEVTAEQQTAIRKIQDDSNTEARSVVTELFRLQRAEGGINAERNREAIAKLVRDRDEKVCAVLNEKQREAWKALTGPPGPPSIGQAFPVAPSSAPSSAPSRE